MLGDKLSEKGIFPHGNTIIVCDVDYKCWRIREKTASCSVLVLMPKFIFLESCLHIINVLRNLAFLVCSTICSTLVAMVLRHCQYPQIILYSLALLLFPLLQTLQNHQFTVSLGRPTYFWIFHMYGIVYCTVFFVTFFFGSEYHL